MFFFFGGGALKIENYFIFYSTFKTSVDFSGGKVQTAFVLRFILLNFVPVFFFFFEHHLKR